MPHLPGSPIISLMGRWTNEAERFSSRIDKWMATYRGYSKLKSPRITPRCRTPMFDSDDEGSKHAPPPIVLQRRIDCKPGCERMAWSTPTSPVKTDILKEFRQPYGWTDRIKDSKENSMPIPENKPEPYGWTDRTKDWQKNAMSLPKNLRNQPPPPPLPQPPRKKIQQKNLSIKRCCCGEKGAPEQSPSPRKEVKASGVLQVVKNNQLTSVSVPLPRVVVLDEPTNAPEKTRVSDIKYLSFRRRSRQGEDSGGFFSFRQPGSAHRKSPRRHKKRVGGTSLNDPMWPAVLLTFDRGVSQGPNSPHHIHQQQEPEVIV